MWHGCGLFRACKGVGPPQLLTPDLRRTFVSHLLAAGEDISTVAKMAGHSSTQTTARYDRRGVETFGCISPFTNTVR